MTATPDQGAMNEHKGEPVQIELRRRTGAGRLSFALLLGILGVGLCGAGIAWACAPGNYGWSEPQAPPAEAPPPSQGGGDQAPPSNGTAPTASQPAPSSGPEAGAVDSPSSAPVNSPSASPVQSPGRVQAQSPSRQPAAQGPAAAPQLDAPGGVSAPAPTGSDAAPGLSTAVPRSADSAQARAGRAEGTPADASAQSPAAQSATGDLWSAFEAGGASSLTAPATDAPAADTGPGTGFEVGLALLGLGLAALFGGVATATVRRRRRLAPSHERQR